MVNDLVQQTRTSAEMASVSRANVAVPLLMRRFPSYAPASAQPVLPRSTGDAFATMH